MLTLAKTEAEKLVGGMPHLAERDRRAILYFAESIANKLLHTPQVALKKDTSGDGVSLVTAVQRLFDLTVVDTVEDPSDAPGGESADAVAPIAANQKKASG